MRGWGLEREWALGMVPAKARGQTRVAVGEERGLGLVPEGGLAPQLGAVGWPVQHWAVVR